MYGCNGYINECISISCREIKTPIHVECRDFDSIDMDCRCLDEKINVSCSIVCSIKDEQIISMLFNELMLENKTLLINDNIS